ncbi:hypothetical protein ACQYZY_29000 [Pseudomonas aeruginosa]|jgi:hypothetical protein|uniref:hypothetical protein n=1 Tax=Pseudomonas aeruginosa TaxID=287 RepID=UPI001A2FB0CE|nr:hypothetical protein [Pseudomonas aeruginosa]MBH4318336.1 hypothetical protein [Pseudomonas aeruginosa]MBH8702834.1 hypothetical protein [Pseudomonas aeruginosa]WBM10993.1 hypothetical protein M1V28_31810 [Pseudomonas aeruginosa]HCL4132441.1 hypothetical protein [Pseudomonas aeruginosa]
MATPFNAFFIAAVLATAAGCSAKYEPRETILDEQNARPSKEIYAPKTELERIAYQEGVQQVLVDMKGKMRARNRFTWDAPHMECGVRIPARVVNGMLQPSHEECVQIAPGRWTEEAPTFLPELGQ